MGSWGKYSVNDEIVTAKKIVVFAAAKTLLPQDNVATIEVGCYPDLPGIGSEFLRDTPSFIVSSKKTFFFIKRKECYSLYFSLGKIFPKGWQCHGETRKEVPYEKIASGHGVSFFYFLEKKGNIAGNPLCIFTASQERGLIPVHLAAYTQATHIDSLPTSDIHIQLPQGQAFLRTEATIISQTGGTVEIPYTGIGLEIPPGALPAYMEQSNIQMRVSPNRIMQDEVVSFSSNSSVAVELYPDGLQLQHPVKLRLPHCLELQENAKHSVRIFTKHYQESQPKWREQIGLSYVLNDNACIICMDTLCCVKYSINDEIVIGKKIVVYTAARNDIQTNEIAGVEVGYYPDMPGEGELLRMNPNLIMDIRNTLYYKEKVRSPLQLYLDSIVPPGWKCCFPEQNQQEISFRMIAWSVEHSHLYILQKTKETASNSSCRFIAAQDMGDIPVELVVQISRKTDVGNYERLKEDVSFMLQEEELTKLAKFFEFSSSQMDTMQSSIPSAKSFFFVLEERGIIHPSDVSELEKAFFTLNINGPCYNKIVSYQNFIMKISPYDKFNAQLASHITLSKARELCNCFEFTNNTTESIIASHNPGLSLLLELDKTFVIKSTDVKALVDPFKKSQLVQAVAKIQEYQSQVTQKGGRLQQAALLTTKDRKKILFIECLKTKMKYWYDTMTPVPWKRSCKWKSTELFVGSRLIFKDSQSTSKHTLTDKKCKVHYREIFSHANLATAKRIIVEGEPGCGKTMLTAQLGYDWYEGFIKEVEILVLLPLKFVGNKTLLESIKEFYIPSTIPLEENDIDEILSSATDTIGVLLDGLEEYSYHESSEVAKVFKENKHPNWKVVLTSRLNCAADLPTFPTLQIDLFGEEERNKYIANLYVDNEDKKTEVKAAINNSALILDLCSVPLLFVLAVHSLENESSLEKDHFERAGIFMRNMISTLTAKHDIQNDDMDGPKVKHSTNSMLYLGEVAFNGLKRQQLYWQRNFLESNVDNFQQWIDSGIFVIEEELATTTKEAKQKEELKVKEQNAVPQQYDDDEKKNTKIKMTDKQGSVMQKVMDEQRSVIQKEGDEQGSVMEKEVSNISDTDDTSNQTPSKDVITENTTSTPTTTKHVPQRVKFLHKVIQEWFAAAHFSTMLKKCTNRDQYDEYVSEHLPHISPTDLHYLLRFACFLHPPFCHTVMNHLLRSYRLKNETVPTYIMDCIFLCFAEHHGIKYTDIEEVVANVCTEDIIIHSRDSRMLQRAKYAMLKFASESRITIEKVHLTDVITDATKCGDEKYVMILNSGLEFNVLKTVRKVEVSRWDKLLKENQFQNILEFLSNGSDIKEIICVFPDPPPSTIMDKTKNKLLVKNITVTWIIGDLVHPYNPTEGQWEFTTKRQMTSSGRGSDQRRHVERTDSLETRAVVSKRRCVLTIAGTGVELHIPPNAFQDHEKEHTVTMRIIPYQLLDEPSRCFEDHSTAVVEILPNKAILQSAAKLILPHCLKIRNPRDCDVQVFQSHHEPGQKPNWRNISESVSFALFHNCCEISLKNFCWVKYELGDKAVIGKKLIVYATGDDCKGNKWATVDVGYYQDLKGEDKIYQKNKKEHSVTQSFMFLKEPSGDLDIKLTEIEPDIWKPKPIHSVINYDKIELSVETRRSFSLKRPESTKSPLSLCCFIVSKGDDFIDLHLNLMKTKTTPDAPLTPSHGSMNETVTDEVLLELSPELRGDWKFIGRWLPKLEERDIDHISANNTCDQREMSYQMLCKWKKINGQNATYDILENAFTKVSRNDLVEKLKTLQGAS